MYTCRVGPYTLTLATFRGHAAYKVVREGVVVEKNTLPIIVVPPDLPSRYAKGYEVENLAEIQGEWNERLRNNQDGNASANCRGAV